MKKHNKEEFIEKANLKYNNKFDYSKFKYIDYYTKSIIICPEHNEFLQNPINHITSKYGYNKCADKIGVPQRIKYNKEKFIEIAKKIHGNKFDYSKFIYKKVKSIYHKALTEEESIRLLETNRRHDSIKDEYCRFNDIGLLRISYLDFNNIEKILSSYLGVSKVSYQ